MICWHSTLRPTWSIDIRAPAERNPYFKNGILLPTYSEVLRGSSSSVSAAMRFSTFTNVSSSKWQNHLWIGKTMHCQHEIEPVIYIIHFVRCLLAGSKFVVKTKFLLEFAHQWRTLRKQQKCRGLFLSSPIWKNSPGKLCYPMCSYPQNEASWNTTPECDSIRNDRQLIVHDIGMFREVRGKKLNFHSEMQTRENMFPKLKMWPFIFPFLIQ